MDDSKYFFHSTDSIFPLLQLNGKHGFTYFKSMFLYLKFSKHHQ